MELRLPSEYQEVEYIENTGTQYIITDLLFPKELESPKIEWGFMQIAVPSGDNMVFGYWSNGSIYFEVYNSTTLSYASIGKNHYDRISNANLTKDILIAGVMTKETMYLNGYSYATNAEDTITQSVLPMAIFAWNTTSGVKYINKGARIYYLRFFDGNTKMADYVPCYRKSDGEIGMYDTVTKTFYTNSGTDTFLKGVDITRYIDNVSVLDTRRKILLNTPHIDTSAGDLVTFNTDLSAPLKECKVYFEPVQEGEGDPSPDNVRNITGWNGCEIVKTNANLWNDDWYALGNIMSLITDETDDFYGYYNGYVKRWDNAQIENGNEHLFPNGVDKLTVTAEIGCIYKESGKFTFRIYFKYTDGTEDYNGGNATVDAQEKRTIVRASTNGKKCTGFRIGTSAGTLNIGGAIRGIMVSANDERDIIAPVRTTYPITFPEEASIIYGGYVDLVSGELIVDKAMKTFDGSETWNTATVSSKTAYQTKRPADIASGAVFTSNIITRVTSLSGTVPDNVGYFGGTYLNVYAPSLSVEEWIAMLTATPLQIVYKLADPIHYQLTPQQLLALKGTNNVYSNTNGQTEIKYWKH